MKTILVTSHDTEVGKTWVCSSLIKALSKRVKSIQYVKPISTGSSLDGYLSDCNYVLKKTPTCNTYSFYEFEAPLAPVQAAREANIELFINDFALKISSLPSAQFRVIETAGGIGVPLDSRGDDFCDLLTKIHVDYLLLVIDMRMGAINQARMLHHYVSHLEIPIGFWINQKRSEDLIVGSGKTDLLEESLVENLKMLNGDIWAKQKYDQECPEFLDALPQEIRAHLR